ncbi:heterodisulfide reductase-related iron-sulfur binding cluster [Actinomycetospora termitidis]|uniref:Heterodisulfide reductase-related iron-sulfur binding cluster n=1 Tax=Actinomycetospora termitidis TaxID=3053470 RepID=A0ABT7M304_9PSEU|nr:heterodisulfide reductase-related iron-sulfur binding cluster [Actinomycetospora sp. Odt1-22]MDL5155041.1 heterodisulfide reductase-related iron-sulfur binding cluster [Actinomycetospora sp. Odt1-22]
MLVRLILGLALTVAVGVIAARRAYWLFTLIRSGQPDAKRSEGLGARLGTQIVEVAGQRKLLRWSIPGLAHLFTMWGFVILLTVYIEAYGALFVEDFHIPLIGRSPILGFLQDFIAVMVLLSIITFGIMRVQQDPERKERSSRFYGSHTSGAWIVLFLIFNVVWTLFAFRGVSSAAGNLPYESGAYVSIAVGQLFTSLSPTTLFVLETIFLLLHIGVALVFLVQVLYSKHLHIFIAPINVAAKRLPKALGPLQPIEYDGKPIDFEDPPEEASFGRGKIEDFTWKGMLDFETCTECGRCQSQCPAWNTGKPLSPKLLIMDLRDHMLAKAPYMIGGKDMPDEGGIDWDAGLAKNEHGGHGVPESGYERHTGTDDIQAARPLVGTAQQLGVIDPEVLWSCTTCGACVEQCPVDIEHVDHIVDMRRNQVMIESEFPGELGVLFRNLENKGNPWGQNNSARMDWAKDLPFEVPEFDGELSPETEYLFFIGCAGAFDDNAKKTVRATAELLHIAGVDYVVLGKEESCTGDPARRSGNEFLFQMMAMQTKEMLDTVFEGREPGTRKIVTTCPHCMNTLGREYPQLDGHYEVVHHTQLLNQLVREKKLIPVAPESSPVPQAKLDVNPATNLQYHGPHADGTERGLITANGHSSNGHPEDQAAPASEVVSTNGSSNGHAGPKTVTYHDPCYLGRHNEVYTPPRELVEAAGAVLKEMPRHADRALCCGAGGARMWMEENIGKRINMERVDEAISTEPDTIATGCPFCRVMLTDGLTERQSEAKAVGTEVMDVSQMLLAAVKRGQPADGDQPGESDPATTATSANVQNPAE